MRLVVLKFCDVLRSQHHLCESSEDVRRKLQQRKFRPGVNFCKMDIKDFFMDVFHEQLVQHAFRAVSNNNELKHLRDLLEYMLHWQFVSFDSFMFQVQRGSGMGTVLSGDLM